MTTTQRLWAGLGLLLASTFAVLLYTASEIYRLAPPMPDRVTTEGGQVLFTADDLQTGRQVWQSMGGMQVGSIWGHGALISPNWSADWLHRESIALLDIWSLREYGKRYSELSKADQLVLEAGLREALRRNRYDPETGTITVLDDRGAAIGDIIPYYDGLFRDDPAFAQLRETYAMKDGTVDTAEHRRQVTAFFFWTAWSAVTSRPGQEASYTSNWPYEPLVGNEAAASSFLWPLFSILFMLAGIALLAWHYAAYHGKESPLEPPARDPLLDIKITPSMRATAKYFWVVVALFLVQILLGAITAHYQVEKDFYGVNLSEVLPYSLTRSWHTQLAVLWIATAWLGTGLYIGPAVSGHEPKFQRLGVNFLFICLLIIVVGAFTGQWLAVMQKLGLDHNFWFGHQGWEYTDIGRFWQAFLFIGLTLFCVRGLKPHATWPEGALRGAFWSLNIGLALMALLTLGVLQLNAALEHGYWYARSAEFMGQPLIHLLVWMRIPGDTVFACGALFLGWFVLRLWLPGNLAGAAVADHPTP